MNAITYSKIYSSLAGRPTFLISEAQARKRHASGEPYTVTIGDPESPDAVLDVVWKNNHLGVWFFDDKMRRTVHFSFDVRDGRLFLHVVTNWKYPEGAVLRNEASVIEEVCFTTDGVVTHEVADKSAEVRTIRHISDVDVAPNWDDIPAFGEWESVSRFDRE